MKGEEYLTENKIIQKIPSSNNNLASYNIDLAEELTNGANIEIKYEIIVKNESDRGTVKISKLFDYIDDRIKIETDSNSVEWVNLTGDDRKQLVDEAVDNNVIVMTEDLKNTELQVGQRAQTEIVVKTGLSSAIRELNYINIAEIGEYTTSTGKMDLEAIPGNKKEHDTGISEETIIHPPTGASQTTYYLLYFTVLLVFTSGIIWIKKKVIK